LPPHRKTQASVDRTPGFAAVTAVAGLLAGLATARTDRTAPDRTGPHRTAPITPETRPLPPHRKTQASVDRTPSFAAVTAVAGLLAGPATAHPDRTAPHRTAPHRP
jgi:hypothetical protein